jgi:DNA-binding NtrC family response regulator
VGNTPEIIRIKKMISGLGKNDDAILIQGERGTGRELLAKSIHFASDRNEDAFIVIDIADHISKTSPNRYDWMNNQILTDRSRSFLANGGGTIYFKAIDLLPLSFQGSFLQFFHDDRIGKTRIIADSEIKIDQLVQKGLFRKDLYYRLNVIKIDMPPLRERKADISSLIDFFVTRYCIESNVSHFHLSDKVKKAFSVYDWPQNVEELERIIDRKELLTDEDRLINELDKIIRNNKKKTDKGIQLKKITQYVVSRIESEILKLVLEKTNWNRRRAANTLTISYKSLLNKIKAYNLN